MKNEGMAEDGKFDLGLLLLMLQNDLQDEVSEEEIFEILEKNKEY